MNNDARYVHQPLYTIWFLSVVRLITVLTFAGDAQVIFFLQYMCNQTIFHIASTFNNFHAKIYFQHCRKCLLAFVPRARRLILCVYVLSAIFKNWPPVKFILK